MIGARREILRGRPVNDAGTDHAGTTLYRSRWARRPRCRDGVLRAGCGGGHLVRGLGHVRRTSGNTRLYQDWFGAYEELEYKLEEILDLGHGVTFATILHRGRPGAAPASSSFASRPSRSGSTRSSSVRPNISISTRPARLPKGSREDAVRARTPRTRRPPRAARGAVAVRWRGRSPSPRARRPGSAVRRAAETRNWRPRPAR